MRFDWQGSVSEQTDFALSGADSLHISINLPLSDIGISNTKIKLTPEALNLFKTHQVTKPTTTIKTHVIPKALTLSKIKVTTPSPKTSVMPSKNYHRGEYFDSTAVENAGLPVE